MAEQVILNKLRRAVDERIPSDGTEANTNYTDAELEAYLKFRSGNFNVTASDIWLEKASSFNSKSTDVTSYSVAGESYSFAKAEDAYNHAMAMHKLYLSRASSTVILSAVSKDDEIERRGYDISRLTQDHQGW